MELKKSDIDVIHMSFLNNVGETLYRLIKHDFPEIQDLNVTRNGDTFDITFTDGICNKEDVLNRINELRTTKTLK